MPGCDPKDFFDQHTIITNDLTKFVYFDNLSNDQYQNLKDKQQLGATIPIYGVPVNFNWSHDQAKQTMQILREAKQIYYTEDHQKTILANILAGNGLSGYKTCVEHMGGVGTYLSMEQNTATSEHFFIYVKWQGGVGGPNGEFNFVGESPFQIIGGSVIGAYAAHPPRHIQSGQEISVEIKRDLSQDFQFTTAINGNAPEDKIYLPKYQPRPIHYNVRNSEDEAASSSAGGGADEMEKRPVFVANQNERFLPATASLIGYVSGNHNEINIIEATDMQVKWRVWAKRADNTQGAFATAHVNVISVSW